jgi:hypothetical protein
VSAVALIDSGCANTNVENPGSFSANQERALPCRARNALP